MIEFKSFRASQDIFVVLPSLDEVQNEVSTAKSWLKNSELFLASAFAVAPASCSLLRLESLKVLFMLIDSSFFTSSPAWCSKTGWSTKYDWSI